MRAGVYRGVLGRSGSFAWSFRGAGSPGVVPRLNAAARLAWLSFPLSVIRMRANVETDVERRLELCIVAGLGYGQGKLGGCRRDRF